MDFHRVCVSVGCEGSASEHRMYSYREPYVSGIAEPRKLQCYSTVAAVGDGLARFVW
jgi:hypothetical protein